jgi:hypothetical protein
MALTVRTTNAITQNDTLLNSDTKKPTDTKKKYIKEFSEKSLASTKIQTVQPVPSHNTN